MPSFDKILFDKLFKIFEIRSLKAILLRGLNFLNLKDTPSSYSGQAGKIPAVKSTEDGITFVEATAPGPHKTTHQIGGSDVIDVGGLGGVLSELQKPGLDEGLASHRPSAGVAKRLYYSTDTKILDRDNGVVWQEVARGETAIRLAQLAEKAHASLTGVGASDHHVKTGHNEVYGLLLSDLVANRPAAGILNRFFWATDEHILYRDTGATWVKAAVANHPDLNTVGADDHHPHANKVELDKITDGDHDVRTDDPHNVTKTQVGLGNVENLKVNLTATVAPTATDDSGLGYAVGGRWADITADKEYVCLDATVGAAVWIETTGAGGVGAITFDELTDTPANKVGQAGKVVGVNSTETALEYTTAGAGVDFATVAILGTL